MKIVGIIVVAGVVLYGLLRIGLWAWKKATKQGVIDRAERWSRKK